MGKAIDVLKHIEELYVAEPDFEKIQNMAENNPERVEAWEKAFSEYDLVTVNKAVDKFWNFKSSKSRPTVAQLRAILESEKKDDDFGKIIVEEEKPKGVAPAEKLMQRDIEQKCCRHLLPVYRMAVSYVLGDLLLKEIPTEVWRKMSFDDRYAIAKNKGLFDNFDKVLVNVCQREYGKEYQFESETMIESYRKRREFNIQNSVKVLGSHFRTDEAAYCASQR